MALCSQQAWQAEHADCSWHQPLQITDAKRDGCQPNNSLSSPRMRSIIDARRRLRDSRPKWSTNLKCSFSVPYIVWKEVATCMFSRGLISCAPHAARSVQLSDAVRGACPNALVLCTETDSMHRGHRDAWSSGCSLGRSCRQATCITASQAPELPRWSAQVTKDPHCRGLPARAVI